MTRNRGIITDGVKCLCGCGAHTFWASGYIKGHEPELDSTQYDAPLVAKEADLASKG